MSRKKTAYRRGVWAETVAAAYFLLRGYRLLARRYRTPVGEIDLLFARQRLLLAVEVKAHRKPTGEEITPHQQARIARAVEYYQLQFPHTLGYDIRMDAVWVGRFGRITHLKNAW